MRSVKREASSPTLESHAVPCSRRSRSCRQRREMDVVLAPITAECGGWDQLERCVGDISLRCVPSCALIRSMCFLLTANIYYIFRAPLSDCRTQLAPAAESIAVSEIVCHGPNTTCHHQLGDDSRLRLALTAQKKHITRNC